MIDKNNKINLLKINNNKNNINDNKNINLDVNKSFVLRMRKQTNKIKDGIENRNKGNSPPLFNRINTDNNKPNQKQLKKIKIGDKKNMKYEPILAKSSNNSQNKYTNMKGIVNNNKNKVRFSPIMNDKKNGFLSFIMGENLTLFLLLFTIPFIFVYLF